MPHDSSEKKLRTSRDIVDEIYAIGKEMRDKPQFDSGDVMETGEDIIVLCMELHGVLMHGNRPEEDE